MHPNPDMQKVPLFCLMEADFFSLYPSIIAAHNLSPETVATAQNDTSFEVDLNAKLEGKDEVVVFVDNREEGVLPKLVKPLLKMRLEDTNPESKETVKMILVHLYGIMGSRHSPFYSLATARAITALGRIACHSAVNAIKSYFDEFGVVVVCANTDSVTFTAEP